MCFNETSSQESYALEGLSDFTLTSEYFEKDIVIDDKLRSSYPVADDGDITTIKVYKENGIEEVRPQSLKQYIESNNDIKKVVIEKISLEEASRVSLFFEPDQSKRKLKLAPKKSEINISEIEDRANANFLIDKLNSPSGYEQEGPTVRASLSLKSKSEFKRPKFDEYQENKEFAEPALEQVEQVEERKENLLEFPPLGEDDQPGKVNKKFTYEKHSLNRKKARKSANYYYRVNDHMELFKVGTSYLRDYQSGIRSMGFASYNLKEEGEKTIFGISSFFNYHDDLNICIITSSLEGSFYESILEKAERRKDIYTDEEIEYELFHADGHDFIEYEELSNVECRCNHLGLEDFIDYLVNKYDLIFWDLPSLDQMNKSREVFFPVVRALESLTLIVGSQVSKGKELDELISYFQKYQVPIKGVLFSESQNVKDKKSKKNKMNKKKKEATDGAA